MPLPTTTTMPFASRFCTLLVFASLVSTVDPLFCDFLEDFFPNLRYQPYADLTVDEVTAATTLGYTESTWNFPGTADIEAKSHETLSPAEKTAAGVFNLNNEDNWDCWINRK